MDANEVIRIIQEYADGKLALSEAIMLLVKAGAPDFLIKEALNFH